MPKHRFTKELLDEILHRDKGILIGTYETLNKKTKISFTCICGITENTRDLGRIYEKGAFCQKCIYSNANKKRIQTLKESYNIENISQLENIKTKKIEKCLKTLGVENPSQSKKIKEKKEETTFKNHGVKYPTQSNDIREKIKHINIQRLGVENPSQSKKIKEKKEETTFKSHGVKYPAQSNEVREKSKQTNIEKYGVEYPMQSNEVREKSKQTNIEKYGVEYPSQNKEVMEKIQKNAKKYKEIVMPSGAIRKVQGYEPYALKILVKIYKEEQIKTDRKDVPRVQYEIDGKKKYHFPDIFIPHENKLIEVKSTWTLKCKTDNIKLKKKACEEQGFLYEIWCFDGKGRRVELPV